MPGTWFGGEGRVNNPVGSTTIGGGLAGLVASIVAMVENDPSPTTIAGAVVSVLVILFGEKVRRQPPA